MMDQDIMQWDLINPEKQSLWWYDESGMINQITLNI